MLVHVYAEDIVCLFKKKTNGFNFFYCNDLFQFVRDSLTPHLFYVKM